jgi:hypothetical protein
MLSLLLSYAPEATDAFEPGFFRWDRRGRVPVPVRVWFGQPLDPIDGTPLDRSWRWQFEFNGFPLETFAADTWAEPAELLSQFWPKARDTRIERGEYQFLVDTVRHDRAHDPYSPFSSASGKVDLLSASIPTPGD